MLKEVTEDCFIAIMQLVESGDPNSIFGIISERSAEDCARLYVASLLLQGRPFPDRIKVTRYSTALNDSGVFFELYKKAASSGIGGKEVEKLYNNTELPDMIWTKSEREEQKEEVHVKDSSNGDISKILKDLNVPPLYTLLKPGACPLSNEAKLLRKKGAKITSYKVVINKKSVIVNVIKHQNTYSYDINSFYCKDLEMFSHEFIHKFMK